MSVWGVGSSARSCDGLLNRVEANDPTLVELVILPLKSFGPNEVLRLARCLERIQDGNTHLRSLQASGHAIDDPTALEALGKALAGATSSLVDVAIGNSTIGDDGVCAFCRGLMSSGMESGGTGGHRIESIDLSWKGIGTDGLAAVLAAFGDQSSLLSINLSRNGKIGPSFDFLVPPTTISSRPLFRNLTYLDLSECQLDAKSCVTLLRAMKPIDTDTTTNDDETNMTANGRKLVLNLNSNDLSDTSNLNEMMTLVVHSSFVSELYISNCNIGDMGLEGMVDRFVLEIPPINVRPHLLKLDVSHNNLTPKSVKYFASTLMSQSPKDSHCCPHGLTNLQTLNLAGNSLDESSCQELASAITSMALPSLLDLDMSKTICGVAGARALISSSVSTSLISLNLFGNQLGSDGFLELSQLFRRRGTFSLETLDLGGNGASEASVVALLQPLVFWEEEEEQKVSEDHPELTTLRVLVVGGNEGGTALESVVKEINKIYLNLDIARDKPRRNGGGTMTSDSLLQPSGTTWMP